MNTLHLLYVPGLGDGYDPVRRACLRVWRLYGVRVTMVPMRWTSSESYGDKRARVEKILSEHSHEKVVLIGESAGGSLVLSLYAKHADSLVGAVTLCGKNTRSDNVSSAIYSRNPAFQDSMRHAESAVELLSISRRKKFISVVPWYDSTVPIEQTLIPGCQKLSLLAVGHQLSIFAMLTIYAPLIVHKAKKLQKSPGI